MGPFLFKPPQWQVQPSAMSQIKLSLNLLMYFITAIGKVTNKNNKSVHSISDMYAPQCFLPTPLSLLGPHHSILFINCFLFARTAMHTQSQIQYPYNFMYNECHFFPAFLQKKKKMCHVQFECVHVCAISYYDNICTSVLN